MRKFTRYILQKFSWYLLAFSCSVFKLSSSPARSGRPHISVSFQMMSGAVTSEALKREFISLSYKSLDWINRFLFNSLLMLEMCSKVIWGPPSVFILSVNKIMADALPWTLFLQFHYNCRMDSRKLIRAFAAYRKGNFDRFYFLLHYLSILCPITVWQLFYCTFLVCTCAGSL